MANMCSHCWAWVGAFTAVISENGLPCLLLKMLRRNSGSTPFTRPVKVAELSYPRTVLFSCRNVNRIPTEEDLRSNSPSLFNIYIYIYGINFEINGPGGGVARARGRLPEASTTDGEVPFASSVRTVSTAKSRRTVQVYEPPLTYAWH
eukprot:4313915-Amphidinium_carterae.1